MHQLLAGVVRSRDDSVAFVSSSELLAALRAVCSISSDAALLNCVFFLLHSAYPSGQLAREATSAASREAGSTQQVAGVEEEEKEKRLELIKVIDHE